MTPETGDARETHWLWFEEALLPSGWARNLRLQVRDGLITRIEEGAPRAAGDDGGAIGLPGLPNLHSHAFQRAMAGLTERRGPGQDDFWTWRERLYGLVERMGPEEIEAVSALAYVEMLESGFTHVAEFHYLHHDPRGDSYTDPAEMAGRIVRAAEETGIGLTLLPVFYAHGGFAGAPPAPGQRRLVSSLDRFADLLDAARRRVSAMPGAVIGVAPHSLRAVTPEELAALVDLAPDAPFHIHAAEQMREVEDCLAWSGARPVEWLLANMPVGPRWCLVHATHMTDAETAALARSGAVAGLCPVTEANLGDGVFPAAAFLAAGGAFGVGSDSNVSIGAADELRLLEYGQRLVRRERNVLAGREGRSTGAELYRRALAGGAQACGVPCGIAEGAPADIVSLDSESPALAGRTGDARLDTWIFCSPGSLVASVWRRGRRVVEGGRHVRRTTIEQRYRRALEAIIS